MLKKDLAGMTGLEKRVQDLLERPNPHGMPVEMWVGLVREMDSAMAILHHTSRWFDKRSKVFWETVKVQAAVMETKEAKIRTLEATIRTMEETIRTLETALELQQVGLDH